MDDFRIYKNHASSNKDYDYLLDIQSSLLSELNTRLVIPLIKKPNKNTSINILNPEILIKDTIFIVLTQQMAAVPKKYLGEKLSDINIDRTKILTAIDFLITGF